MDLGLLPFVLATPVALIFAGKLVTEMVRAILADRASCVPEKIESLLPLKGRWLRLLLAVPALVSVALMVLAASYILILVFLAVLLTLLGVVR